MEKIGRNELCPCGSGKKFKKCHLGREEELSLGDLGESSLEEMGARIIALPTVTYGRSAEMVEALDIEELTGRSMGIRFVDLKAYAGLNFFGSSHPQGEKGKSGGVFINVRKTMKADPNNIYLAISSNIEGFTLIHELAHVLDYLAGSRLMPGTMAPLSYELGIPTEHLEHPQEFAEKLTFLQERFGVALDADDAIIVYLFQKELLLRGKEIREKNAFLLKNKSDRILRVLGENSEEIDTLIQNRPGYIGPRTITD